MFTKNLNKLLSVCVIASGITNASSSELISPTPYAKTMAASIVDSFTQGKASRAFVTAMKSKDILRTGLGHICKKPNLQSAEQEFFAALNQVFSGEVPNVTDNAVDLILESAQSGYADANEIVKAVSGGKTISDIDKSSYPTLKMTIKQRLQGFIDKSSSDDEDSVSDEEIRQLKSYLQIPESRAISLKDLRKRKANRDISLSQIWIGNISLPSANKEDLFRKINDALESYQTYVILENTQAWNSEAGKDSRYLWTLMGMLHSYKDKLSKKILVDKVLESLYSNEEAREFILKKSRNDMGKVIYSWLVDNAPEVLGEYTM